MKVLFLSLMLILTLPSHAATYALIIGINQYPADDSIKDLKGAVNDANIIYDSLQFIGTPKKNMVKLLDADATKKQITNNWRKLITRSNQGDTLIFSFAGHGSTEPDRNGDEAKRDPDDQSDEILLLGGFAHPPKQGYQQRLVDDELHRLFTEAKGRRIIYIADSCYSGDSYRSLNLDNAGHQWQSRRVPAMQGEGEYKIEKGETAFSANADEMNLDNFYFFAATDDNKRSVEGLVDLNGVPTSHGLLSLTFAKALRDPAIFSDGKLTLTELSEYIRTEVVNMTQSGQFTNIIPREGKEVLFSMAKQKAESISDSKAANYLKIKVKGNIPTWGKQLDKVRFSTDNPDYIWDIGAANIYNKYSDLVSSQIQSRQELQRFIDRWTLMQTLNRLSKGHYIKTQLSRKGAKKAVNQHAKRHAIGEQIAFYMSDLKHSKILQFNLAGNGDIQCYSMLSTTETADYNRNFAATAPIGHDNLMTLLVDNPSKSLKNLLDRQSNCPSAIELANQLPSLLQQQAYQLGRVDIFIGAKQ
jgi:hypothetical protein